MDKFDKVVMLIEHGFTKEEIDKILPEDEPAAETDPEPAAAPAAPKDPEPAPAPATEPEPAAAPAVDALAGFMQELKSSVDELKKAVQAGNVNKITTSSQTVEDMNDILATFINPPRDK